MKKLLIILLILFISTSTVFASNMVTQPKKESVPSIYLKLINDTKSTEVESEEYPEAAFIWNYLKNEEYNDYVIAGILGNLMAECGGQTLDLSIDLNTGVYYGTVQWSIKYNPYVVGEDLEGQMDYLMSNIEPTFDTYGKNYKKGFKYKDFLELEDEREAALAFAKCYGRCSSASYNKRKENAVEALDYFIELTKGDKTECYLEYYLQ